MKGTLIVSLDFELFWGMLDCSTLEVYGENVLGGRRGIPRMLELFRKYGIPVKFDGRLDISTYRPIELLNLRVQAVTHPFDERLSFRALCECGEVMPQEWDLFRMNVKK